MYTWLKNIARWEVGNTLYLSVPFTWLMSEAEALAAAHKGKVLIGGPGTMRPTECPGFEPILFHNPAATFTTRGCPNECKFCAVPKLEGGLLEVPDFRPAPVICDNNFTAASKAHQTRAIDKLRVFPLVDFNQGLEARLFTPWLADQMGRIKCKVRFSFDHLANEKAVYKAVKLCRERTTKDVSVYVLFGFKDTPEEARYRMDAVVSWGLWPNPMRYQPLSAGKRNEFVGPGWTKKELAKMSKYYNNLRWTKNIPYDEFFYLVEDEDKKLLSQEAMRKKLERVRRPVKGKNYGKLRID